MADQLADENGLQGFNEDELKDIMSEIENLEKESLMDVGVSDTSVQESPKAEVNPIKESDLSKELGLEEEGDKSPELQDEVDGQVNDLKAKEVEGPAAKEEVKAELEEEKVTEIHKKTENRKAPSPGNGASSSMSFDLSGQINMNLNFTVGNKSFSVSLDDSHGVVVKLQDGMTFTIPLDEAKKAG